MGRLQGRGLPSRLGRPRSRMQRAAPVQADSVLEAVQPQAERALVQHPFAGRRGSRLRDQFALTLLVAQDGVCRMCGAGVSPTLRGKRSAASAVVDHLRPWRLRPDLVAEVGNLQLICRGCHATCDAIEKRLWPDAEAIAAEKRRRGTDGR